MSVTLIQMHVTLNLKSQSIWRAPFQQVVYNTTVKGSRSQSEPAYHSAHQTHVNIRYRMQSTVSLKDLAPTFVDGHLQCPICSTFGYGELEIPFNKLSTSQLLKQELVRACLPLRAPDARAGEYKVQNVVYSLTQRFSSSNFYLHSQMGTYSAQYV